MKSGFTIFYPFCGVRTLYFLIALFCVFATPMRALAEDTINATSDAKLAVETPEQHIKAIELRHKELDASRKDIAVRLAKAGESDADDLKQQIDLMDQISAVLVEQIGQWHRNQELDAQKTADQAQLSRLEEDAKSKKTFSVLELDRAREQRAVESARVKVVRAKFDLAKQALQEAVNALKRVADKEQNDSLNVPDKTDLPSLKREFAEQQKILRELELRNEDKAFSIHETLLRVLNKQVEVYQQRASFDDNVLKERFSDISRLEFDGKRDLARLNGQKLKAQSLLESSRRRLEDIEEDKKVSEEIETRSLELDAIDTQIEIVQREQELFAQRKDIWQKRYDVFNDRVEQQILPQWRKQADQDIASIQEEQATLNLWLSDWRSRLNAVNSKLAYAEGQTGSWHGRQQQRIQEIIDRIEKFNIVFDSNHTLLKHLIDDINVRNSQRSLLDWVNLIAHLEIGHDSLLVWSYALAIALATFSFLYVLRWFLVRTLKLAAERKHFEHADELLSTVKRANLIFFLAIALYCASLPLTLAPTTEVMLSKVIKIVIAIQIAIWLSGFLRAWIFRVLVRRTRRDGASMGALSIMNFTGQVALWSVAALLILQNLGVDITALVAGLGIGGIAVALALQRILNDLFSSLSIVLDKPFMVGDFIVLGDFLGTVEHIGIKTTRLRSLTGEQIICANGELLDTRIRNFKRMQERRVVFKLGVVYQTTYAQLQQIPDILKAIIEATDQTRFDRAHFFQYGDFSLDFEIVYYVLSPDYNVYMDAQQAINLEIYRQFQQAGIEFAYPTQSVLVSNEALA